MYVEIRKSARLGRVLCIAILVASAGLLGSGCVLGAWATVAAGSAGVVLSIVILRSLRGSDAGRPPILVSDGQTLSGTALSHPVAVAGTSFRVVSDYEGAWVVELFIQDRRLTLAPGGWRVEGRRRFTRAAARQTLASMGISER